MKNVFSNRWMKKSVQVLIIMVLVTTVVFIPNRLSQASTIPTFSITEVEKDVSVSVITYNLPANQKFTVRMGLYGTKAVGGTEVGVVESGSGGSLKASFQIPAAYKGLSQVAIRMDSAEGYYAYNWFYNNTTGKVTTATPVSSTYTGIPTFAINAVTVDKNVTILTKNLPKDQTFTVRMGAYGTLGVGGVEVAKVESGNGGALTPTFDIPDSLKGSYQIAIRMDSADGYYAYNWFYNSTTSASTATATPVPVAAGYTGYPTFSISAVVKDASVTVLTNNLPKDQEMTIRMGSYGTKAIGGVVVATANSGAGGAQTLTYLIPESLKGSDKIAIRIDTKSGLYAFNWFYNNSTN